MSRPSRRLALSLLLLLGTACSPSTAGAGSAGARVLAASSLAAAFRDIANSSGATVQLSFAGSPALVAQVEQGAPADVIATADTVTMGRLARAGRLATAPQIFADNRLAIVTGAGNPRHIGRLADLARPGLVVVLAAPAVPAGRYAGQVLARAGVHLRPASLEENVGAVVTKVALGEADAGIVYVTDVVGRDDVTRIDIPTDQNVLAHYPVALLRDAAHPDAGRRFIELLLSPAGQRILRDRGFRPPS